MENTERDWKTLFAVPVMWSNPNCKLSYLIEVTYFWITSKKCRYAFTVRHNTGEEYADDMRAVVHIQYPLLTDIIRHFDLAQKILHSLIYGSNTVGLETIVNECLRCFEDTNKTVNENAGLRITYLSCIKKYDFSKNWLERY